MENSISKTYHIKGMSSEGCVITVQKILSASSGITSVKVDLAKKEAIVTSNEDINTETLQKAIGNTAYSMAEIKKPKLGKSANPEKDDETNQKMTSKKSDNWVAPPYRSAVNSVRGRHNSARDVSGGDDGYINTGPVTNYED